MTDKKVYIINGEVFENLTDTVYQGWGSYYPTVQQCIEFSWKVGITPISNLNNVHRELKWTANLGIIDPDYDFYTDIDVGVTKGDIIKEDEVEYLSSYPTEIKVGLISWRHELPVEDCILNSVENVLDYDAIANGIETWIRNHVSFEKGVINFPCQLDYTDIPVWESKERLVVYVTGLTPVTAELIRLSFNMGVHLTLMNFNRDTGDYVPQVIS